jgi:hypothetical protein
MSTKGPAEDQTIGTLPSAEISTPSSVDTQARSTGTAVENTLTELSPEQAKTLITLKANFDKHPGKFLEVQWPEVEAKLNKEPAKLATLQKLINRGGEPTVTAKIGDKFRFDELSKESPVGSRGLNWKQAYENAKTLGEGVQLMNKDVYNSFKVEKDILLDPDTWSWLDDSPKEVEKTKKAFIGGGGRVHKHYLKHNCFPNTGFRCSLEV